MDRIPAEQLGTYVRCRNDETYAACILFALFFLGGWQLPFEDTLVGLPYVGIIFDLANATPGLVVLLLKAYLMFILRMGSCILHRVRTDQILEFGWRWLASLDGQSCRSNLAAPQCGIVLQQGAGRFGRSQLFGSFIVAFVINADEDEDALELNRRMYHTQTLEKAAGTHGD